MVQPQHMPCAFVTDPEYTLHSPVLGTVFGLHRTSWGLWSREVYRGPPSRKGSTFNTAMLIAK
eukprot:3634576-Pyramimonas_sp.AAC.2